MAKLRKDENEKDQEKLAKTLLSTPQPPLVESKIEKPKKFRKRLRRPVDSEANT
jgi:hypothetical protein